MMSGNGMRWAELLSRYRQRAGLSKTELARALSVSIGYISKLESGQKPPPEGPRQGLCEVLGLAGEEAEWFHVQAELERTDPTSVKYLLRLGQGEVGEVAERVAEDGGLREVREGATCGMGIPIINKVAAGYPQDFTDLDYPAGVADQYLSVPDVSDPNAFAFYVYGDSMEPDFPAGSLLIASPNTPVFEGDPCFVRLAAVCRSSGCTFKRVYFTPTERVRLVPINRQHPEQVYGRDEITGLWPVIRQYVEVRRSGKAVYRRAGKSGGRASGVYGGRTSSAAG